MLIFLEYRTIQKETRVLVIYYKTYNAVFQKLFFIINTYNVKKHLYKLNTLHGVCLVHLKRTNKAIQFNELLKSKVREG